MKLYLAGSILVWEIQDPVDWRELSLKPQDLSLGGSFPSNPTICRLEGALPPTPRSVAWRELSLHPQDLSLGGSSPSNPKICARCIDAE